MKVIAIDSSGLVASVAIVEDDTLTGEYNVQYKKTHSQTLLPMIDSMVELLGIELSTMDAIAVSGGPGSFTGLRIGSATAKGLGLALNKPLIHVPTLDATAYNLYGAGALICPIMDARRKQVYTGLYCFENHALKILKKQDALPMTQLIEELNKTGKSVIFLGDGVPVYRELIEQSCCVPYSFAPAHVNKQRAAAVAALAQIYYKEGKTESAADHQPDYLRVSQAERERAARLANEKNADN